MNIYDVKVCKFISKDKKENYKNICVLKRSEFVTHYCIVDFTGFTATDIFTGEQFHILQRNEEGKILSSENVEMNKEYATYVNPLDFKQLPWWELYKIRLACFKLSLIKTGSNNILNSQKQKKKW